MNATLRASPGYALFVLWVSTSAFAPEIIWQGFLLMGRHFGAAEIYTIVFIGVLFTLFVEPIAERLKEGRWSRAPGESHGQAQAGRFVIGALLSFLVGVAVVCVHEAMGAFFGDGPAGEDARWANLARAISQALEWASVPAAITVAWLLARISPRVAYAALGVACAWTVAVGFVWAWRWPVVVTTSATCCLIALLGTRIVLRGWRKSSLPALARLVGIAALACLTFVLLAQAAASRLGHHDVEFYSRAQTFEDLRFYLGWCLGLSIAPDPTASTEQTPAGH